MPQQKHLQFDQENPTEIEILFSLGQALVQDGWGVTIVANPQGAMLKTNAPSNILEFYASQHLV